MLHRQALGAITKKRKKSILHLICWAAGGRAALSMSGAQCHFDSTNDGDQNAAVILTVEPCDFHDHGIAD